LWGGGSAEAKERGYITWCHEGMTEDVLEATTTSTKKFGITSMMQRNKQQRRRRACA
jgi:hypothetical protein